MLINYMMKLSELIAFEQSRDYFKDKFIEFPIDVQEKIRGKVTKANYSLLLTHLQNVFDDQIICCEQCDEQLKLMGVESHDIKFSITHSYEITDNTNDEEIYLCSQCLREVLLNWI